MPSKKFRQKFFSSRAGTLGSNKKSLAKRKSKASAHKPKRTAAPALGPQAKRHSSSAKPSFQKKKSNPDIIVKRSAYSKNARAAVLASAAARQQLIDMGGENTIAIIREFDRDMSDEELARKTGIKASDVRVVLNRLHSYGLFAYTRVRDKDSGWYSYIWKMSEERLREVAGGAEGAPEAVAGGEETVNSEDYLQKNILQRGQNEQSLDERRLQDIGTLVSERKRR
ncbi:MAG: hypothetical protein QW568_01480 [Candidatus Anstonellaceae archaeon]